MLLRLKPSDPRSLITRAKAVAAVVQQAGAALLLDGEPEPVARSGADGAHLHDIAALQDAYRRAAAGPDRRRRRPAHAA